jgi:hypothetical protein
VEFREHVLNGMIDQLNNTKKLFIAMILTAMIIPSAVFVITFELLEYNASTLHSIELSHNKGEYDENFLRSETLLFTVKECPINYWNFVVGNRTKAMDGPHKMEQKISKT